ncbi:hypothetical protein B0H10DRAFT_1940713 [Mycena sp. CBHHK59/15]|nr:hypothetical protein B0H10DRAFT_1940713 [Mycena sp. CBHHK59/15]
MDGTNWVGYLLTEHDPHPDLIVHDYAVGGARVLALGCGGAMEMQVNQNFLTGYVMTHTDTIELLFSLKEKLYAAGARIFLFMDVPPIGKTQQGFNKKDVSTVGGAIWQDHLHLTSKIHRIFAQDLAAFLTSLDLTGE